MKDVVFANRLRKDTINTSKLWVYLYPKLLRKECINLFKENPFINDDDAHYYDAEIFEIDGKCSISDIKNASCEQIFEFIQSSNDKIRTQKSGVILLVNASEDNPRKTLFKIRVNFN